MYPLIKISNNIHLPSYLLVISLVYCLGIYWLFKRSQKYNQDPSQALDISLAVMLGGFIGARTLHILYEAPSRYFNNPIEIFKIWQGGFVFYGGFIGALLASYWLIQIRQLNFREWADLCAPILALGYGLGRIACFLNGCCFGKACELPWAVTFTAHSDKIARHPTQIYTTLFEVSFVFLLLYIEKNRQQIMKGLFQPKGQVFFLWIFLHAGSRIFIESLRDDYRGDALLGLSISSWISIAILIASFFLFRKNIKLKNAME